VEELKHNGITVVAIHALKTNRNNLDAWLKKNDIRFPVGMIQGEEEKVRFNWGVKSLPWLILTDRGHIVRAEGFALHELNAELGNR
jgi:hypothetical protein